MRRRTLTLIGLELYALSLAWLQSLGGVRTDEAKYLLDIPYPHPPLARSVLGFTEGLPWQEGFWRFAFASLVVQAVWLVWSLSPDLPRKPRFALAGCWLACAAVAYQAGSVMMAPLNALQGLVLAWLAARRDIDLRRSLGWIGIFWGMSLFTAYQAALYAPLLILLVRRSRAPLWQQIACVAGPLFLVALYALSNPLSLASFVGAGTLNAGVGTPHKLRDLGIAWVIAGSSALTLLGLAGMAKDRRWDLLASALLASAFLFVSFRGYYAILLTPLLVAGAVPALRRWPAAAGPVFAATAIATIVLFPVVHLPLAPGPARETMRALRAHGADQAVLVSGPFGHDWQYESGIPVGPYAESAVGAADAVVCLRACAGFPREGWARVEEAPVEAWIRP